MLLYYTGITRLAKTILQDIVRGMFLGDARVLACLRDIGQNAEATYEALQRGSYEDVCARVAGKLGAEPGTGCRARTRRKCRRSSTSVGDWLAGGKLTGAGGGGYLLLLAKDEDAAGRIRERADPGPAQPPRPLRRLQPVRNRPANHPKLKLYELVAEYGKIYKTAGISPVTLVLVKGANGFQVDDCHYEL